MFALIAHPGDQVAAAAAAALGRHLPGSEIVLVDADELVRSARWRHSLDDQRTSTLVRLADGRQLRSDALSGVLNRVRYIQPPFFRSAADREYAVMELFALLLSWLASLPCHVINETSPRGLAGAERSLPEWLRLASSVGLPTRRLRLTSNGRRFARQGFLPHPDPGPITATAGLADPLHAAVPIGRRPVVYAQAVIGEQRRILVVGARVYGAPCAAWEQPCRQMARRAGCRLLELHAIRAAEPGEAEWLISGASAFPEQLDAEEAAALAELLVEAARGERA